MIKARSLTPVGTVFVFVHFILCIESVCKEKYGTDLNVVSRSPCKADSVITYRFGAGLGRDFEMEGRVRRNICRGCEKTELGKFVDVCLKT